jgi:cytidylate kinase
MTENVLVIAGPSGSGQRTIGIRSANLLGYYHLDAGMIWRYLALRLMVRGVDLSSERDCAVEAVRLYRLAERLDYWSFHDLLTRWFDKGVLEMEGVGEVASKCAVYPSVQRAVLGILHAFYTPAGYVVSGKPWLYENVFPEAFFKVLLVAPESERAARNREGESQAEMAARDHRDNAEAITMEQLSRVNLVINTEGRDPDDVALQIAVVACPLIPVQHRYVPRSHMEIRHARRLGGAL